MYLSPLILLKIRNLHISAPIEGGPAHALRSTRIQDVLVRRRAHRGRAHQRLGRGRRLPPATYPARGNRADVACYRSAGDARTGKSGGPAEHKRGQRLGGADKRPTTSD